MEPFKINLVESVILNGVSCALWFGLGWFVCSEFRKDRQASITEKIRLNIEKHVKDRFDLFLEQERKVMGGVFKKISDVFSVEMEGRIELARSGKQNPTMMYPRFVGISEKGGESMRTLEIVVEIPALDVSLFPSKQKFQVELLTKDARGRIQNPPEA